MISLIPRAVFVLLLLVLFNCKGDHQEKLFLLSSFRIGTTVDMKKISSNRNYRRIAEQHFNSFTCENCMKFSLLSPDSATNNWNEADSFIAYAQSRGNRIHGHALIWHRILPEWANKISGTPLQWEEMMHQHIRVVAGHFKGKVESWDVVNEAISDTGRGMRSNVWFENIGRSYVAKAFQWAAEADPGALLFFNDFAIEFMSSKLDSVLSLCDAIRSQGIRIDGIGVQMHYPIHVVDSANLATALKKIADKNYLVHLSELDVSLNNFGGDNMLSDSILQAQKQAYKWIAEVYTRVVPPSQQHGITFWGFSDGDSWIPKEIGNPDDWPCIFDANYKKKPAYYGFKEGLTLSAEE